MALTERLYTFIQVSVTNDHFSLLSRDRLDAHTDTRLVELDQGTEVVQVGNGMSTARTAGWPAWPSSRPRLDRAWSNRP